jgi:hypothetical protein
MRGVPRRPLQPDRGAGNAFDRPDGTSIGVSSTAGPEADAASCAIACVFWTAGTGTDAATCAVVSANSMHGVNEQDPEAT